MLKVFVNRILKRILGPKRFANGEWSWFHNEELHNFDRSPIVRVIKYRRLRWTGRVDTMEKRWNSFKLLTGKSTKKETLEKV